MYFLISLNQSRRIYQLAEVSQLSSRLRIRFLEEIRSANNLSLIDSMLVNPVFANLLLTAKNFTSDELKTSFISTTVLLSEQQQGNNERSRKTKEVGK